MFVRVHATATSGSGVDCHGQCMYLRPVPAEHWPRDGLCYRGGGLPDEHRWFFQVWPAGADAAIE